MLRFEAQGWTIDEMCTQADEIAKQFFNGLAYVVVLLGADIDHVQRADDHIVRVQFKGYFEAARINTDKPAAWEGGKPGQVRQEGSGAFISAPSFDRR